MEKEDSRRVSPSERLAMRKAAIRMLKKGKTKKEISACLGVRPNTITEWSRRYDLLGIKGLQEGVRGVKSVDKKR